MSGDEAINPVDLLPRCAVCTTPRVGVGECLYCRAVAAEGKLAALSHWGADDWMRRIADLAIDEERLGKKLTPLGFDAELPRGTSAKTINVMARPQVNFHPELFTVSPECAYLGTLVDVRVGNRSMMIDATPVPLSLFSPMSWGSIEIMREVAGRLKWGVVNVAQDISLMIDVSLVNYEPLVEVAREALGMPTPTRFRAALWGRAMAWDETIHRPVHPVAADESGLRSFESTIRFADLEQQVRSGKFADLVGRARRNDSGVTPPMIGVPPWRGARRR